MSSILPDDSAAQPPDTKVGNIRIKQVNIFITIVEILGNTLNIIILTFELLGVFATAEKRIPTYPHGPHDHGLHRRRFLFSIKR